MQRLAGIAAFLSMSIVLAPLALAQDLKLGFAHVALNNPYYLAMQKSAIETAQSLGATIDVHVAEGDVVKQNGQIEAMLASGITGLVVNSISEYGTMASIKHAKEKGVPVVAIDRPLYGDYLAYVGIDQFKAGTLQGEYIAKTLLPEGGNIVLLLGIPGEPATIGRSTGMTNVVQHPRFGGKYKILASYRADYNMDLGYQKMKEAITAYGDKIDLVYGLNDAMVLGAQKALHEVGLNKVLLCGVDGQKEAYAEIAKGGAYRSTVINNPSEITRTAVELLVDHLKTGKLPGNNKIITGTVLVTKDNVDKLIDPAAVF